MQGCAAFGVSEIFIFGSAKVGPTPYDEFALSQVARYGPLEPQWEVTRARSPSATIPPEERSAAAFFCFHFWLR